MRRNSPETLKALVDSLRFDPFYVAISQNFGDDEVTQSMELDAGFERLAPTLSAKGAEKGGAPAIMDGKVGRVPTQVSVQETDANLGHPHYAMDGQKIWGEAVLLLPR